MMVKHWEVNEDPELSFLNVKQIASSNIFGISWHQYEMC
jgi:hypothetical protein